MKVLFISHRLLQIAVISCFLGLTSTKLQAQVKIGYEATKLSTSPSAIILQLSNDTSKQAENKAAKALILSNVKKTQQQATGDKMHQGLLHYNVDTNLFAFSRNKMAPSSSNGQVTASDQKTEWKYLRYEHDGTGATRFVKIEKSDLADNKMPKDDGSCHTLSIEKKSHGNTVFIPYQRDKNNNSKMHDQTGLQGTAQTTTEIAPRTRISYNGYTLSPNKDYTIKLEDGASSQAAIVTNLSPSAQKAKKKITITFLTLVPEKWEEFDEFFIEYEVI